jgi:hypothetical protein
MHLYCLLRPNFKARFKPISFGSYHFLYVSGILQVHFLGFLSLKNVLLVLNVEAEKMIMKQNYIEHFLPSLLYTDFNHASRAQQLS